MHVPATPRQAGLFDFVVHPIVSSPILKGTMVKGFLLFLGFLALLVLSAIWTGFVFSVIWGWFIVPTFHLPPLSIGLAIGIGLVVRMLTYQAPQEEKKEDFGHSIAFAAIYPLLTLGLGFLVHLFV